MRSILIFIIYLCSFLLAQDRDSQVKDSIDHWNVIFKYMPINQLTDAKSKCHIDIILIDSEIVQFNKNSKYDSLNNLSIKLSDSSGIKLAKKISDLGKYKDSLDLTRSLFQEKEQVILTMISEGNKNKELEIKYKKSKFKDTILNHQIKIGMTKDMIIDSWGKPEEINRTVGSWGVHEQWIYGSTYLYVENDKLTSFQDSK
jgi:hypothetical protein